jgi:shikimate dehydrogenase
MTAGNECRFGLLGRTLGHSWSPQIHALLGSTPYALVELEPQEVAGYVREGSWLGLNVTIPYKRDVVALADELSPRVAALGAANTLVRRPDGSVLAENTDVLGFEHLLESFCRARLDTTPQQAFGGRKVLVLGSGGASEALRYALERTVGAQVVVISRSGADDYASIATRHADAALVVNAPPVGMYPRCPASPLEESTLTALGELRGVVDIVYNPLRTGLVMMAERLGIPAVSGLGMLVAQAFYASELFQGTELDPALVDQIEADIERQMANVVLIGMPGSGKTGAGRRLAHMVHRPFVDVDDAIELELGCSIPEFFAREGEAAFREEETRALRAACGRSGLVIACGGGVVTRPENYEVLHQNGVIVMIDRPLEELATDGRPVSQSKGVARIAQERMPLYRSWADVVLACTGSAAGDARALQELFGL